jgi:hypothetical protein
MKKIVLVFLCFPFMFLQAAKLEPFALLTVPKSGSHLTIKALYFMTGASPVWHTHFPSSYYLSPEYGFLYTHLCVSPELENNYKNLPRLKKIVNIRDLRDVCVSMVSQIEKGAWPGMSPWQREHFKRMSFDEKLLFVMEYDYDVQQVASFAPNSLQVSLVKVAKQAVEYTLDESCLVCRYENLVGPLGGGSEKKQRAEMEKMAKFLGIEIAKEQMEEMMEGLYGDTIDPFGSFGGPHFRSTFNTGKIGSWRHFFTQEHKRVFKEKLGSFLIALGYEQDNSW